MATDLPTPIHENSEEGEFSVIRITRQSRVEMDQLASQLKASGMHTLVAFLIRHYKGSTPLNGYFDWREICALTDRLHAVLLFLATTNLELAQHLRRTEAGYYRRLVQYGDELVRVQNRILAERNRSALAPKS